ncbi:hypothetical protein PV05_03368 [Exophiala xenobiotica]|uniref:Uncharacterized protein n=1 Tax=Exophiala xenobiotica TaxID=348802 RepID=A0A0D2EVS6_9EURO|nr:uncharacterized protein PV05_03368 [Exophiala xenobiotica]KIW58875.1 hypothetical protein PV05_03368 [Exophiala xenobiotica]
MTLDDKDCRQNLGTEETFWETYYPDGIEPKFGNENREDTQQINLVHRLELPEARDLTACQTFPPRINACKHCDQDPLTIEVAKSSRQPLREYLFKFRQGLHGQGG